jgi:hypothetical protein
VLLRRVCLKPYRRLEFKSVVSVFRTQSFQLLVVDYPDVLIQIVLHFQGLLFSRTVVYVGFLAIALYISTILSLRILSLWFRGLLSQ